MRGKGLFITGADTGVGKTIVTAGLVRLARVMGLDAVAVKPVETGCLVKNGELFPEDGHFLWEACHRSITLDECCPFRFVFPAAPYRAAAVVGSQLFPNEIRDHINELAKRADITIVEGAGGLMVPIHDGYLMIDLIAELGFPVLLVSRSKLGTLNHTMLSIDSLRHLGVPVAGIVVSFADSQSGPEEEFVVSDLKRLLPDIPVYGLDHLSKAIRSDADRIATHIEAIIPKDMLLVWFGLKE